MKRSFILLATVALASAACATSSADESEMSEAAAERLAQFERTGETQSCLPLRSIAQIKPLDDRHFLVRAGSQYYLNKVSSRCHNAHRSNYRLQYRTSQSQLCRLEIINVVDNSTGFTAGSCSLGDFEKLTEIEAPAE